MSTRRWTDEELRVAVGVSRSRRQVLLRLGLAPYGGNYLVVKQHIRRLDLSTAHFLGMGWNKGGTGHSSSKIPLSEIMVEHSNYQSHKLKKRLIKENLLKEECLLCGWQEVSRDGIVPLELDHINGNHYDNRMSNLRILCPNCHSLQSTHRGRNRRIVS